MRVAYTFDSPVWGALSDKSKDFVSKLLVMDPKQRMTADTALKHSWIVEREMCSTEIASEDVLRSVDDCLLNYKDSCKLKRVALNVIAHRSSTREIEELRNAFKQYDTANNGVITFEEFQAALKKLNYRDETINEIFASVDVNGNQKIMFTEFIAATIEVSKNCREGRKTTKRRRVGDRLLRLLLLWHRPGDSLPKIASQKHLTGLTVTIAVIFPKPT